MANNTRGIKNIVFGLLSQILTFAVGIIIPRLVLINLGSEANGLLSSVNNVLGYMSLLEAGVGTATLQALYKPCAVDDKDNVNHIMSATNYFYKRTGIVYLIIVVGLAIGYTAVVNSSLSKIDVFAVVLLCGFSGVISYFFQGKFRIFLIAEGKTYVNTNIVTIIHIATNIIKAILLYTDFGVVEIQVSAFILNLVQTCVYIVYMKRHYAWLDTKVKPAFEAISQRNSVLVHQISSLIFSNTDVLVLTIFTSLNEVSVYSMYALMYGMVKSVAIEIYNGYTYALGQTYNTDREKFIRMFDAFEVVSMVVTFSLFCICRALMNPFLRLYTEGVNDIAYVDQYLPWMFAAFYILHNGRTSSNTLINIAQHFELTKWRSIVESVINVTVSILCVRRFGVYGVLLGTIAALLYRTNDMIIYASHILGRSSLITYKRWLRNIVLFAAISLVIELFSINPTNYMQLILVAIVVGISVVGIFISVNALAESDSAIYVKNSAETVLRSIIHRK